MSIKVTLEFETLADAGNFLLTASGSVAGDSARVVAPAAVADTLPVGDPVPKTTRGRGRPVRGETQTAATSADVSTAAPAVADAPAATVATAVVAEPDPFASATQAPAAPAYTRDDVAAAGRALGAATSQENAVAVMKAATGAGSFGVLAEADYGKAVQAFQTALAALAPAAATPAADPFGAAPADASGAGAGVADHPSEADLKKVALATQKRCGDNQITPVLVAHGGVQATAQGNMPSLKAVPIANRAKLIAALQALPTTKA